SHREVRVVPRDVPNEKNLLPALFQDLADWLHHRRKARQEVTPVLLVLNEPPPPDLVDDDVKEWYLAINREMKTFLQKKFGWILYFANPKARKSLLPKNPDPAVVRLPFRTLEGSERDTILKVYASHLPMPDEKHLKFLTGGFVGFE